MTSWLDTYAEAQKFNSRLLCTPDEWRGPVVDVIDTMPTVKIGLSSIGIEDSFVLIEVTRLVLERHDKLTGASSPPQPERPT